MKINCEYCRGVEKSLIHEFFINENLNKSKNSKRIDSFTAGDQVIELNFNNDTNFMFNKNLKI